MQPRPLKVVYNFSSVYFLKEPIQLLNNVGSILLPLLLTSAVLWSYETITVVLLQRLNTILIHSSVFDK